MRCSTDSSDHQYGSKGRRYHPLVSVTIQYVMGALILVPFAPGLSYALRIFLSSKFPLLFMATCKLFEARQRPPSRQWLFLNHEHSYRLYLRLLIGVNFSGPSIIFVRKWNEILIENLFFKEDSRHRRKSSTANQARLFKDFLPPKAFSRVMWIEALQKAPDRSSAQWLIVIYFQSLIAYFFFQQLWFRMSFSLLDLTICFFYTANHPVQEILVSIVSMAWVKKGNIYPRTKNLHLIRCIHRGRHCALRGVVWLWQIGCLPIRYRHKRPQKISWRICQLCTQVFRTLNEPKKKFKRTLNAPPPLVRHLSA